ncbi:MAG: hypothetical protein D6737_11515 [Chloroflexi bacterium]|nr:MAG: hypothetical protein CUN54_03435 [Phototrophicales bacterium]RMF79442.1 MAG: hypothetical protein D6737_11515 [Chloroflexota bacterium]
MGTEFTDFVGQVPIALFIWLCGSIFLLIGVLSYIIIRRNRRAAPSQSMPPAENNPTHSQDIVQSSVVSNFDNNDMPDLELLVETPVYDDPAESFALPDDVPDTTTASPAGSPGYKQTNHVDNQEMRAMTASSPTPRRGTFHVQLVDGNTTEAVEVLTIMRDVVDGDLMVQIGDHIYRGLADDPEAKKRFMKVMKELAQIVNRPGGKAPEQSAAPAAPPQQQRTGGIRSRLQQHAEQPPQQQIDDLRDAVDDAPPATPQHVPPPLPDGRMPGDLPDYDEFDRPLQSGFSLRGRPKKTDIKPVPELNIAQAIEEYLQHKLRHTPEFNNLNLHIIPAQDGGVTIQVGTTFYDAVGDIEDDTIRAFLSQTIQEWQERHH